MLLLLGCGQTPSLTVGPDEVGAWDDPPVETGVEDSVTSIDSLDTPDDSDTAEPGCDDVVADDVAYADLFDASRVHTIELTLRDAAMDALLVDPGEYVLGDVEVDGQWFAGVGVKWRGPTEQMRWDGKPGFKIGFRSFEACDTYAGLTHLTLDGMSLDAAEGRAVVESAVLAELGRVVPRASFVQLALNGETLGVYANVETVDGEFLLHHGLDPESVIWEGGEGADFTAGTIEEWSDVDSDGDPAALEALAAVLQSADDDVYSAAGEWVDMGDFLGLWGALAAVGDAGTYPYDTDDIYLIQDPADPRLRFVPWGLDAGWEPTFGYNHVDGTLGLRCVYDPTCTSELTMAVAEAVTAVESVEVRALADAAFQASDTALDEDPNRPAKAVEVRAERATLLDQIDLWPAVVRAQIGS